jgi:hypothetical protein
MNRVGVTPVRLSQLFDDPSDASVAATPLCTPARGPPPSRTPFRPSSTTGKKSSLPVVVLAVAAALFWLMFVQSVLPHQFAQTSCPENAHVIKGACILRGSPEAASLEFAPELSDVLASQTAVRTLDGLLTYLVSEDIEIPELADLGTAVNFTKNFVVTDDEVIIEKMSEETERLLITGGALLSTAALLVSACRRAAPL